MPPRDMPFGNDTLTIPCYLAKGLDDPGFLEWAKDHPDWFVAGTWTSAPSSPAAERQRRLDATRTVGQGKEFPPLDPATISLADFKAVSAQAKLDSTALPAPNTINPATASSSDTRVALDVTPFSAPITPLNPDPFATNDLDGTTVRLGKIFLTTQIRLTADQLREIMPNAGVEADRHVDALNAAMEAYGINTPTQRAAFLAQISVETGQLREPSENLNYSARQITRVWPSRFPTEAAAAPYAHNPIALANRAYAKRNGNGDEASGDGWRYRGRGDIQLTGRGNYAMVGFEDNPEALAEPECLTRKGLSDFSGLWFCRIASHDGTNNALD